MVLVFFYQAFPTCVFMVFHRYLLTVTLLASVLHLLFEFLAFKSDVSFWQNNKSLRGLSVRTLFIDLVFQVGGCTAKRSKN